MSTAIEPFSPAGSPARRPPVALPADIRGRRKAAVLLVSLGAERAAQVFAHLSEQEIEELSLEMATVHWLQPDIAESVLEEMAVTIEAHNSVSAGGVDYAREVLERALGSERAKEIVGRLSSIIEKRPFEFLRRTPAEQIATFLRNESPQMTALVIAHLNTPLAAAVLSCFSEAEQPEIALRIARMSETSPIVVHQVEEVMREKLATVVDEQTSSVGGIKSLAELLNQSDRSTERNVLDTLAKSDEELSAEVRRLLFVFEDIGALDDRSIQLILREADQKDLALALRGVPEDVKTKILSNLSERGAQNLREEMEYQPPQRKRDIEEAQSKMVAIVRRLEDAGTIVLGRSDEEALV